MGGDSHANLKCYRCKEYFQHRRSLNRHIDVEHRRPTLHKCEECGATFNRKDNLQAHVRHRHPKYGERRSRSRSRERASRAHVRHHSTHRGRSESQAIPKAARRDTQDEGRRTHSKEKSVERLIELEVSPETRKAVEGPNPEKVVTPTSGKPRGMMALMQAPSSTSDQSEDEEMEEEAVSGENADSPVVADVRKVQIGRLGQLSLQRMTPGQLLNVGEHSSTAYYRGEEKVFEESKERRYQMIVLRRAAVQETCLPTLPTKVHKVVNGKIGSPMSTSQLEEACVGRVHHIKETAKRQTYHDGELAFTEEITSEYDVSLETGFLATDCR